MTPRPDPHGRRAILGTRVPKTPQEAIALYHRAHRAVGKDAYLLPSRGSVTDEIRPIHIRRVEIQDRVDGTIYDNPQLLHDPASYCVVIRAYTLGTAKRQYLKLNAHAVLLPGEEIPQ